MKQKKTIEERIEETLNSFDGIQPASPQPWLFTRIKGRLMKMEEKTIWDMMSTFLSKPTVAIVALCLILSLNGVFLFQQNKESSALIIPNQNEQPSDSESLIASSSSFDYETLVQP